jgi:hypothetical protein
MLKNFSKKLACFLAALVFALSPVAAQAFDGITEEQMDIYRKGIRYFNIEIAQNAECWSPANSTPSADRSDFIEKYSQYAIQVQRELGLPYEAIIAQAIYEGGVPESVLALQYFNYFGIKYYPSAEENIGANGKITLSNSSGASEWATFPDPQSGWTGYGKFITTNPRYSAVYDRAYANDPIGYIKELLAAGYAGAAHINAKTNPNDSYVSTMKDIISQVHTYISENHPDWATMEAVESEAGSTGTSSTNSACGTSAGNLMSDDFTVYMQFDSRWGSNAFGSSTIASGGCGPAALAMAITALGGKEVTPADVVKIANNHNVHVAGQGSSHVGLGTLSNQSDAIAAWGNFPSEKVSSVTIESFNEYFSKGYAIFGAGKGGRPYSPNGHYLLVRGVTADGKWKIGDPGHTGASDQDWDPATIIGPMADNAASVYAIKRGD